MNKKIRQGMVQIRVATKKLLGIKLPGFRLGFLIGLVYFSYIFLWIWSVYPLNSLGVSNKFVGFILILFVFSATVVCAALFWGLLSFFCKRTTATQTKIWMLPFCWAGIFVLAEYFRSWSFGILWWGDGSLLGPHWTFGNLAYLFANFGPIIKSSSIWGIYGIDFILASIAGIIFILTTHRYSNKNTRNILLLELGLIFIGLWLATKISSTSISSPSIPIALVQTEESTKVQYPIDELIGNYTQEVKLVKEAGSTINNGMIVLPESSNFSKTLSNFLDHASAQKYFNNLSTGELIIVDNNVLPDQDAYKSRTLLINSKNGIVGFYDKQLISPFGEYVPYIIEPFLFPFEKIGSIVRGPGLSAGGSNPLLFNYEDSPIKILACSDVLSPGISSEGHFGLLISIQNLGIFKGNDSIASQILSILRFRAAENGKYAVLASNYGRSYIINPQGNIVESTSSSGYQLLTGEVVPNQTRTWYNKLGDWPILLLSVLFFSLGLISKKCLKKLR